MASLAEGALLRCAAPSHARPRGAAPAERQSSALASQVSTKLCSKALPLACSQTRRRESTQDDLFLRTQDAKGGRGASGARGDRGARGARIVSVRAALAGAGPSAGEGSAQPAPAPVPLLQKAVEFQRAFWKFLRPHTIRGTVLGTSAVVAKALIENSQAINWVLLPRALLGLLALLCGNGYIVGINQIYDTDIDKVNKPFLPVASGEMSPSLAALLCLGLCVGGVGIVACNFGPLITGLYSLGLLLGTLYSVPPFRLKRFALPAFLIIATVRGLLLNFGVYYATRAALGLPFSWSPSIVFITCFVTVFATVIAITKDLPDVEGDRKFKIDTFATKLGVRNIAFAGSGLLLLNYAGAVTAALLMPTAFRAPVMVTAHLGLALALLLQTRKLDQAKYTQESIAGFYRFIWNLFYLEYCLLPLI